MDTIAPSVARCDGCGSESDVTHVTLCNTCLSANNKRLAAVKRRLADDVDWEDVKKYGLYDRHGVPIATVLSIQTQNPYVQSPYVSMMSTGPIQVWLDSDNITKVLIIKELKR